MWFNFLRYEVTCLATMFLKKSWNRLKRAVSLHIKYNIHVTPGVVNKKITLPNIHFRNTSERI